MIAITGVSARNPHNRTTITFYLFIKQKVNESINLPISIYTTT